MSTKSQSPRTGHVHSDSSDFIWYKNQRVERAFWTVAVYERQEGGGVNFSQPLSYMLARDYKMDGDFGAQGCYLAVMNSNSVK